jgi:hypothetical protein
MNVNPGAPESLAFPATLVTPVVLLLNDNYWAQVSTFYVAPTSTHLNTLLRFPECDEKSLKGY